MIFTSHKRMATNLALQNCTKSQLNNYELIPKYFGKYAIYET